MRRWTRDGGQTSAELLGLIVVVGGIILAIATSNLGGRIADGMSAAICRISGGDCETTAEEESSALDGAALQIANLTIVLPGDGRAGLNPAPSAG